MKAMEARDNQIVDHVHIFYKKMFPLAQETATKAAGI
jgi:hypothetical protein